MKKITIKLDKERELKYTLNSLIEFENITGKAIGDVGSNMDMKTILAVLYVGLIHEDKKLTMDKLGDMITIDKMIDVNKKVMEAFTGLK